MKTPNANVRPASRPRAPSRLGLALALLAGTMSLGPQSGVARAGERALAPSPEARAAYWLDRIERGPEPSSFPIPGVFKDQLLDAERNLAAIPDATLARLADKGLQRRLESQYDANPWHAILAVLASIGSRRPDVARAWAVPALTHELLTLRRAAIEVFEALKSPDDGPVLLATIERDAADRLIGPRAASVLLRLGPPWDAAAARVIYARAPADGPLMSSGLWAELPSVAAEAPGGARTDLLAWWSFLTENAGPRRADPVRGGNGKGRAIDPEVLSVVAVPHALTSGARAAAAARLELARSGSPARRAESKRDAVSRDPDVRSVASAVLERVSSEAEAEAIRAKARGFVVSLGGQSPPSQDDVASVARALRADESPEALLLLTELFRAIPLSPTWKVAVLAVFDGLVVRAAPLGPEIERLLALNTVSSVDLALFLARRSGGATFIPAIEAWLATPESETHRLSARRDLGFLYGAALRHGTLPTETLERIARTVVTWVEDASDPSAAGFVAMLADLGPVGEARIVDGLRGPKRALYVDGLSIAGEEVLGADVTEALVEPIDRRMAAPERQRLLVVVLHVASGSATPVLESLRDRLGGDGRADVDSILRVVRHRESIGR